jgi:multiple sugar transport system permease protein
MATSTFRRSHERTIGLGRLALMLALAAFFLFPIMFMFVSSFKPNDDVLRDTASFRAFLPVGDISLDNYAGVFERVPAALFIFNSLLITCTTVALGIVVNSLAGYACSRLHWRGREMVLTIIIATLIVPFETIAIPLLLVVTKLPWIGFQEGALTVEQGWLNTYQVQILPFVANAFSIFLFAQFFKSLPIDLDEAARVDGASEFQIYRKVIMPLSGPVVATVAILTFLPIWNAYLWPLMVVQSEGVRPVMVGLQYFFKVAGGGGGGGGVAWGEIMAYLTMVTLPILILYLLLQRHFVETIASSGVKG